MKTVFWCFKLGECVMSILTDTTKEVLIFVKTILTGTIL